MPNCLFDLWVMYGTVVRGFQPAQWIFNDVLQEFKTIVWYICIYVYTVHARVYLATKIAMSQITIVNLWLSSLCALAVVQLRNCSCVCMCEYVCEYMCECWAPVAPVIQVMSFFQKRKQQLEAAQQTTRLPSNLQVEVDAVYWCVDFYIDT